MPIEEQRPEWETPVIVTLRAAGKRYVAVGRLMSETKNGLQWSIEIPPGELGLCGVVFGFECVLAWMELPEPFEGGTVDASVDR